MANSEEQIKPDNIPGLLEVKKSRPISKIVVKLTQVNSLMRGQQILDKVRTEISSFREREKEEAAIEQKKMETEMFFRSKSGYVCTESPCCASRLRLQQCSSC